MLYHHFLRLVAEIGPRAALILLFFAVVIVVFLLYVGLALIATLLFPDELRYKALHDLLDCFRQAFHDLLDFLRPWRRK